MKTELCFESIDKNDIEYVAQKAKLDPESFLYYMVKLARARESDLFNQDGTINFNSVKRIQILRFRYPRY